MPHPPRHIRQSLLLLPLRSFSNVLLHRIISDNHNTSILLGVFLSNTPSTIHLNINSNTKDNKRYTSTKTLICTTLLLTTYLSNTTLSHPNLLNLTNQTPICYTLYVLLNNESNNSRLRFRYNHLLPCKVNSTTCKTHPHAQPHLMVTQQTIQWKTLLI